MSNKKQYNTGDFISYKITGKDRQGKRFCPKTSANWLFINMYNIWRGTLWGILPNGKKVRLKSYYN